MSRLAKIPRNNTDFSSRLYEFYRSLSWPKEWSFLKYYQNTIRAYCDHVDSGANGLLAYLGMGMGKSILAASIAVDFLLPGPTGFDSPEIGNDSKNKRHATKCIFILTKSLAENMKGAIRKYFELKKNAGLEVPGDIEKFIADRFTFVSMNASNMIVQFIRAVAGKGLSGSLSTEESVPGKILLKDTLVIVDEAHNLFRGITNGSKNGLGFYKTMEASLAKPGHGNFMLFLTGTPINNNPFELVPCFNMLAGEEILPTDYEDFREAFVNREQGKKTMKNAEHFMDRILGLVAYATHETTPGKAIRTEDTSTGIEFPEDLGIKVCLCPMAPDQYSLYLLARELEASENTDKAMKGKTIVKKLQLPKSSMTSSYRTKSRQLSNFYEDNLENKDLTKIKNPWAPKYQALLDNVIAYNQEIGTLGLVYSQYVSMGGLGSLAEYLKKQGWKEYSLDYVPDQVELDNIEHEEPEDITETAIMNDLRAADLPEPEQENLEDIIGTGGNTNEGNTNEGTESKAKSIKGSGKTIRGDPTRKQVSSKRKSRKEKRPNVQSISMSPRIQKILGSLEENDAFESLKKRDPYEYTPKDTKPYKNRVSKNRSKKNVGNKESKKDRIGAFDDDQDDDFWNSNEDDVDATEDFFSGSNECNDHDDQTDNTKKGGSRFYNEESRMAPLKASKTFAVIKGGLSPESRKRIENIMQSPDNRHGEIVSLVLVSSVGAEGLDFKAIRHVHILEPYWNYARIAQIQYRGIRNDSHKSLPVAEKNVQTYIYCAIPPEEIDGSCKIMELEDFEKAGVGSVGTTGIDGIPDTTDTNLLGEAVKNYRIIESFLGPIQRSSITAGIDAMPGARLCAPTGRVLYTKNIGTDLKLPDQCRPYVTKKVEANSVEYAGKKYYYVSDPSDPMGFKVFYEDKKQMRKADPNYVGIIEVIENIEGISLF